MSEEATLDEFVQETDENEQSQNWREVRLQEVAYKRSENVDPQEVELDKHVGLEHIEPNNPMPEWESLDGLSSTKRRFEAGDILFAKLRPNLEKSAQPDFDGVASTDIFPIVPEQGINSKYLLYRLSSKSAFDYARRTSAGTRMPRTSWNLFSNFDFDLPPLPEQRKIATVLYTVDRAIEETEKIVGQYKTLKMGILVDLLSEGTKNYNVVERNIGPLSWKIPEPWSIKPTGGVAELVHGHQFRSDDFSEDGKIPVLKIGQITDSGVDLTEADYVPERDLSEYSDYTIENDVPLIALSGATWGKTAYFSSFDGPVLQNYRVGKILPKSQDLDKKFLYVLMQSKLFQKQLRSQVVRQAQENIGKADFERIRIPIPEIEEQKRIANIVFDIEDCIATENRYKQSLSKVKNALMQDLLSGTVRATNTNIEVPDEIAQHG